MDIRIRRGEVPQELSGRVRQTPLVQVNERGQLRYTVRNVADFLVSGGGEVIIDSPHADDTPDIAVFLLGPALGFLGLQRGLFPLQASTVVIGGRTVALMGPSATGKSTVAALLLAEGAELLSDDVTMIDVVAPGGPTVLPGPPRQKLWRDTLDALGIAPGRRLRRLVDLEKFDRPVFRSFDGVPRRLDALCRLHPRIRQLPDGPRLVPQSGLPAVRVLHDCIYRRTAADLLGLSDRVFQACAMLATTLPNHALTLPDGLGTMARVGPQIGRLLTEAAR